MEIDASDGPKVGLFYYVDGIVYQRAWNASSAYEDSHGIKGAPRAYSHSDLFQELYGYPKLREDYPRVFEIGLPRYRNHFLRGRVVFDSRKGVFVIMANRYVSMRKDILERIARAFHLEGQRIEVVTFSTYEIYDKRFEES